jgi:hypothetical protein
MLARAGGCDPRGAGSTCGCPPRGAVFSKRSASTDSSSLGTDEDADYDLVEPLSEVFCWDEPPQQEGTLPTKHTTGGMASAPSARAAAGACVRLDKLGHDDIIEQDAAGCSRQDRAAAAQEGPSQRPAPVKVMEPRTHVAAAPAGVVPLHQRLLFSVDTADPDFLAAEAERLVRRRRRPGLRVLVETAEEVSGADPLASCHRQPSSAAGALPGAEALAPLTLPSPTTVSAPADGAQTPGGCSGSGSDSEGGTPTPRKCGRRRSVVFFNPLNDDQQDEDEDDADDDDSDSDCRPKSSDEQPTDALRSMSELQVATAATAAAAIRSDDWVVGRSILHSVAGDSVRAVACREVTAGGAERQSGGDSSRTRLALQGLREHPCTILGALPHLRGCRLPDGTPVGGGAVEASDQPGGAAEEGVAHADAVVERAAASQRPLLSLPHEGLPPLGRDIHGGAAARPRLPPDE